MTREQKFWIAVYNVIGETSHLVDIGVLTDNDYSMVMKALTLSIAKLREQNKEESKMPTIMVLLHEDEGPKAYFFKTVEQASAFCDVATGSFGYELDVYNLNEQDQYEYSHTLN